MLDVTGVRIEQGDLTVQAHEEHEPRGRILVERLEPVGVRDDGRRLVESGCKHSQRSARTDHDAVVAQYQGSPDVPEFQRSGNHLFARDIDPDRDV